MRETVTLRGYGRDIVRQPINYIISKLFTLPIFYCHIFTATMGNRDVQTDRHLATHQIIDIKFAEEILLQKT